MKHTKIITKLLGVLAGVALFASFSPSLDGRAVVVDEGVMPSGLFAKTVGYLPGDIITVSNVNENKTVEILVIGALDPSEGVAIMLTPEAAKACGIEKDSDSIVKITKRNGQDDRVYGNAVISSDAQTAPEKINETQDNPSADTVAEEVFEEENVDLAENTEASESEEIASTDDFTAEVIEKPETEETAEVAAVTPVTPVEDTIGDEIVQDEVFEEIEPVAEEFTEDEVEDVIPPAVTESAPVIAAEENDVPAAGETFAEELDEDIDEDSESYEAIVLVPAAANPPVNENYVEKPAKVVETPKYTAPASSEYISFKNLIVSGEKDLRPHSYYIQIATMRDDANIQEIVNRYGNNYPITIVQLSNNSKQILIGSLNMDEYAVVLERFKSYGYKDAFLRKIR